MSRRRSSNGSAARVRQSALLITNLGKLTGMVLAILEWAQPGPAQDSVLALCAVLILGAEAAERMAMAAIRSLIGRDESS